MKEATTVLVEKSTRKRLKGIGSKGETYDQIINRILDERGGSSSKAIAERIHDAAVVHKSY